MVGAHVTNLCFWSQETRSSEEKKGSHFFILFKEHGKCTFCHEENEDLTHLFWKCRKNKNLWDNFSIWLQSCQILQPGSYLDMTTALGLTPDSSSFKLHINFCCLIAKNFIWICRSKECFPIHNNFLFYLRHIYQLENKTPRNTKGG